MQTIVQHRTMGHLISSALILFLVGAVTGCSNNDSSGSRAQAPTVSLQLNQNDLANAQVRSIRVSASGLPNVDTDGVLQGNTYVSNAQGQLSGVDIAEQAISLFQVVGRVANTDGNVVATQQRCQWHAGCEVNGDDVAFGAMYPISTDLNWRAVAYGLARNESIRISPLTELATALAFEKQYFANFETSENTFDADGTWQETGYFNAYSVLQSYSQLSNLLGIADVLTTPAADLSQLAALANTNTESAQQRIRHGALLAAWQYMALTHDDGVAAFTTARVDEFVEHNGQWLASSNDLSVFTLAKWYGVAIENLNEINVPASMNSHVMAVIELLLSDKAKLENSVGSRTAARSDDIKNLLGDRRASFELGLARSKAFVDYLQNLQTNFWQDGYKKELDEQLDAIKAFNTAHKDDFNDLMAVMLEVQHFYRQCVYDATTCNSTRLSSDPVNFPKMDVIWGSGSEGNASVSYDATSERLTFMVSDKPFSVEARAGLATSTQAIDLLMDGEIPLNNGLAFTLKQKYRNDDLAQGILSASGVRVFFAQAISELPSEELVNDPVGDAIAFELRWSDFVLQDAVQKLDGSFRALMRGVEMRGVEHPTNNNKPRRFNLDTVVINSQIAQANASNNDTTTDKTTLLLNASAENAASYYPNQLWPVLNGFFNPSADAAAEPSLPIEYALGTQTINGDSVEFFDVKIPEGESFRYRFYPNRERVTTDGTGKEISRITTHDVEECRLQQNAENWSIERCAPKQRVLGKRDRAGFVERLWRAGGLSQITVEGQGRYFIEWPATLDDNGCYQLDALTGSGTVPAGLIDAQVLGLNNLRFTSEVQLENQPRTLLDVSLRAPRDDFYQITAALSHNYSNIDTTDTVFRGTGNQLQRIIFSYDTQNNVANLANLAIFQAGVSLEVDDNTETLNSELIGVVQQMREFTPLAYRMRINEQGESERCIVDNTLASAKPDVSVDDKVWNLNFRGVAYGQLRKDKLLNGNRVWLVRFVDGTFRSPF
ncbi:MAG: hypothetical protein IBX52_09465 [Bacterioplanes sp.]|nr:hypothetical protein [Bacterioplanes sp.]